MATKKKLLQAAAGSAGGGAGLNVEDVFNTYLYSGNGSSKTITNNIDLSGEGGLVWIKDRDNTDNHFLTDTERGATKTLRSNNDNNETTDTTALTGFTSSGFTLGSDGSVNQSSTDFVAWTFRKARGFFDIVTWTGDGSGDRTISHNLGTTIGAAFVKNLDSGDSYSGNWQVFHRSLGTSQSDHMNLNTEDYKGQGSGIEPVRNPTSTTFLLRGGGSGEMNVSGVRYVAYLFAHNNDDAEFGPDADADIIKCGSYTGNTTTDPVVDLGFEPQWILVKNASRNSNWGIYDVQREMPFKGDPRSLAADSNVAENAVLGASVFAEPIGDGFVVNSGLTAANVNGDTHIYIAIRKGLMGTPDDVDKVFSIDPDFGTGATDHGFPPDWEFVKNHDNTDDNNYSDWFVHARNLGYNYTNLNTNSAAGGGSALGGWDNMVGTTGSGLGPGYLADFAWAWRNARGFFDVSTYYGTGSAKTVPHSLGVVPEMIWVKCLDQSYDWRVYHESQGNDYAVALNSSDAFAYQAANKWNATDPTESVFSVGTDNDVNQNNQKFVAYLFATLNGISKVGSYTGTGSGGLNIDCGFSNGAKFVLIKCASHSSTDWHLMDSERGIVTGNDPWLITNGNNAEDTSEDIIDPYSAGFSLPSNNRVNTSGRTYIFYAIAKP